MHDPLATRLPVRLEPQPSRVIAQLFVPGHALGNSADGRRASRIIEHVLQMGDREVDEALEQVATHFGARHRDLESTLLNNADRLSTRLATGEVLPKRRQLLLGAVFTREYAVEGAALCNPSAVVAPDQTGVTPGDVRFVLSVRQIGEGHHSSIGFRVGVLTNDGSIEIEDAGAFTTPGVIDEMTLDAAPFRALTDRDNEGIQWVLATLGSRFTSRELANRVDELEQQRDTRPDASAIARHIRHLAERHYAVQFPPASNLGERVLMPATSAESNGLEDARFVRFEEPDGTTAYHATYTAYNGTNIAQQLLSTVDFASFTSSPLVGLAAENKGLALFPRRIGGRYHALSRRDGATNGVAISDHLGIWNEIYPLDVDPVTAELLQVGNCGPPIELDTGWLVLTHGVGPMRNYTLGALLLDLHEPWIITARTTRPLLTPQPDERDGYVPNVVYSCGSLRHGDILLVPYGIADSNIGFATFSIDEVLAAMREPTRISSSNDADGADRRLPLTSGHAHLDATTSIPSTETGDQLMADKSPRQKQSKKSGKSLKEKREDKKVKQSTKRPAT